MLAATARCFSTDGIWAQDSQFGMPLLNGLHASGVYQAATRNLRDHPPPRAGWIHEVKHDGYRTVLIIERHKARAYTRNGFDWTDRYSGIVKAAKLDCRSAIIDGLVIVQDERGVSDLTPSNQPFAGARRARPSAPSTFFILTARIFVISHCCSEGPS